MYIHGDPTFGQKRGISLNSASTTIKNSYIAGIVSANKDTQAICGWNGPGPFTITNNYLEASGENLLFGGADPAMPSLVPSDITITRNQFSKPLAWWGQAWTVKNLLEFKNAQRVVIDGNILENNWLAGQSGYASSSRRGTRTAPRRGRVVQQIQFTNNVVRHVAAAINILGSDYNAPSQQTNDDHDPQQPVRRRQQRALRRERMVPADPRGRNITVDHNTVFSDGTSDVYADGPPSPGFVFTNNIMQNNAWAIMGNSASPGNGTIAAFFPGSQFLGSVIAGARPRDLSGGNFYPANLAAVGFINLAGGNYRLSASSLYIRSATDGTNVGANIDAINAAAGTQYSGFQRFKAYRGQRFQRFQRFRGVLKVPRGGWIGVESSRAALVQVDDRHRFLCGDDHPIARARTWLDQRFAAGVALSRGWLRRDRHWPV